ncbi:T6SS phospholipase effector Tle1-like catalytic domain-containing protein [Acinetobacter gerneri]|jgi:hypothetical protein|uniref:T6SS phospholipase effector Tle1-like catalytic domain-containing protein n=1 Tax=Acinetobacter gerneri TaxID=202952 RepID=UPI0023F3F2ED|nr:DUF2235 domain-containing protein [Acinetobacter gerneri]MCH4244280.1 DUF2235 domain-containing protein [Acinetobacter gerneri]
MMTEKDFNNENNQIDEAPENPEDLMSADEDENVPVKPINKLDKTNPKEDSKSPQCVNCLEISVFFDGTWNNRTNSDHYNGPKRFDGTTGSLPRPLDHMNDYKYDPDLGPLGSNISYARLPTTVDRMQRAYKEGLPHHYSLYVDGCGTGNAADIGGDMKLFFADNPIGAGLGWGSTGVKSKIKKAFKQLNKMIRDKTKSQCYQILIINLFGFSRGSATARIFANLILNKIQLNDISPNQRQIVMPKNSPMQIQLKFMGIFDCVSSIGFVHGDDEGLDFAKNLYAATPNDEDMPPSDMTLNMKQHEACRIVHLAAMTEYRDKFSLYDISSAIEKGIGVEIRIPGCHTDLGDGLGTKGKIAYPRDSDNKEDKTKPYWYVTDRDEEEVTIAQKKVKYKDGDNEYNQTSGQPVYDYKPLKDQQEKEIGQKKIIDYNSYDQQKPSVFGTKDSALAQMERVDFKKLKANLVAKGLFIETADSKTQIKIENTEKEIKKFGLFSSDSQYQRLNINRKQLSMLYPIIPANIMIELCKKHHLDAFEDRKLFEYDERYAKSHDTINNNIEGTTEAGIWGQAYDDMKAQALAWDAELDGIRLKIEQVNQSEAASQQVMCKPFDVHSLIKEIEPQNEFVRKKLYNYYIHWSSQLAVEEGITKWPSRFSQVSLGQINCKTHMFERTFYKG